jgi:chitin disaccharide deacetylase
MTAKRYLIINADDFGQSIGVNRGIINAHQRGVVTSASLMVRWPDAARAAAYCREHPSLSLGLHLDLGEWVYRDGTWVALYEVVPSNDLGEIVEQVHRQLATFRRLTGKDPTHIDSHQHVHRQEPIRGITVEIARKLDIPLRHYNSAIYYCGEFYGQTEEGLPYPDGITVDRFMKILAELQPGFTELGCHPGEGKDLDTMYRNEREEEVKVLCDPNVQSAIVDLGTKLCSFADFAEATRK